MMTFNNADYFFMLDVHMFFLFPLQKEYILFQLVCGRTEPLSYCPTSAIYNIFIYEVHVVLNTG